MSDKQTRLWYVAFASTIFVSSFLLFQIQPLIGKYILPWFGGAPGVWTTCLLFFQVLLFAGYVYAHTLTTYLSLRWQCAVHVVLIAIAICLLPIAPDMSWKPTGNENPISLILGLLATSIGLPYFLLSANGPLLQAWFSRTQPDVSPYGLYSLSNIASLLGLLSYPFVVEPRMSVNYQATYWSWGFGLFAAMSAVCCLRTAISRPSAIIDPADSSSDASPVRWETRLFWVALPACGSIMLLATTNQVCLDVAAIPFLWVIPLMLYLLTFILSFANPVWYPRRVFMPCFAVALASLCVVLWVGAFGKLWFQLAVYFPALFICCMVCHGEMVALKPHPSKLTSFYMWTSAGGALGGLFVGLLAPYLFNKYVELHIGMLACCVLIVVVALYRHHSVPKERRRPFRRFIPAIAGVVALAIVLPVLAQKNYQDQLIAMRNFYGVLRVRQNFHEGGEVRSLYHGQILHGAQFQEANLRKIPTTYYGEQSGIGKVFGKNSGPRRVGIVGLGTGTVAAYGRTGDVFRFYDINPYVVKLANEYFTYLQDSAAKIEHVLGDARLSMERETPQNYDVLVVDAFSSDAIPTHLLTKEAFEIYLSHLRTDGFLIIHVSNRHFNLKPVIHAAARHFGLWVVAVKSGEDALLDRESAIWMLLARSPKPLTDLQLSEIQSPDDPPSEKVVPMWTDNFTDLFRALR